MPHRLAACGLVIAALALAAPAAAQTVDELVVLGHTQRHPDNLSYRVSYRDIDVRTPAGEKELRRRVDVTISYVCGQLNEAGPNSPCRAEAAYLVRPRVKAALDRAKLKTGKFVPGPAWTPPPGYK